MRAGIGRRSGDLPTLLQNPVLSARYEQCRTAQAEFQERRKIDAFWARVDKSGGDDACWLWSGTINGAGYGVYHLLGEFQAHRIAYALSAGSGAGERKVLHAEGCPRHCVNPAHLTNGTQFDNMTQKKNEGRARGGPRFGRGELNNRAKYCQTQITVAWEMRAEGYTLRDISVITGIVYYTLQNIFAGQTWGCIAPRTGAEREPR